MPMIDLMPMKEAATDNGLKPLSHQASESKIQNLKSKVVRDVRLRPIG